MLVRKKAKRLGTGGKVDRSGVVGVGNEEKAIRYQKKSLILVHSFSPVALGLVLSSCLKAGTGGTSFIIRELKENGEKAEIRNFLRPSAAPWAPIS